MHNIKRSSHAMRRQEVDTVRLEVGGVRSGGEEETVSLPSVASVTSQEPSSPSVGLTRCRLASWTASSTRLPSTTPVAGKKVSLLALFSFSVSHVISLSALWLIVHAAWYDNSINIFIAWLFLLWCRKGVVTTTVCILKCTVHFPNMLHSHFYWHILNALPI